MDNSTSIHDLPSNPSNSSGNNVSFSINEQTNQQAPTYSPNSTPSGTPAINSNSLDQNTINQIISGLQKASSGGATQLQSRDIPQNTESIVTDAQVQPSYIPPPPAQHNDYISEQEENEEIVHKYENKQKTNTSLDSLYSELQMPLLIAILYFLFQLPIFKKLIFQYLPILCLNDGNINVYGYLFISIMFGIIIYILSKTLTNFNTF